MPEDLNEMDDVKPTAALKEHPNPPGAGSGPGFRLKYSRRSDGVVTLSWSIDVNRMKQLTRISGLDRNLLIIFVLPLIILLLDSNVFFGRPGWLDTWMYYSFFGHLHEFKSALFPNTYYGSRMSWILPGYIINAIFRPLTANYVLHLLVYYTGAYSLYYVLRHFYGRSTAILTLIAFTCNPYLWGAVGTDYVDGFGIACYLLVLAILTSVNTNRRVRPGLILSGVVYAALMYSNTVWFLFSPIFLSFYVFLRRPRGVREIARASIQSAIWFVSGVASLTVVLGAVNYRIDGHFWFYWPSIQYTLQNANSPKPWHSADYNWIWSAHWLVVPAVMLAATSVASVGRLVRGSWKVARATWFFRLHFVVFVVIFALLELRGLYMLEWAFYASYLIPATFLLAGAELFATTGLSRPVVAGLCGGIVLFLAWFGIGGSLWTDLVRLGIPAVLCIATGAILLRAALPANRVALAACLAGFGLLNLYGRGRNGCYIEQAESPYWRRNAFVRMREAVDAIDEARQGRRVVFWFDAKDPHSDEFDSINSFFLWGYTWIGRSFPAIDPVANDRVTPGEVVAVLSTRGEDAQIMEQADRALKPRGLAVSPRARREISYGGASYTVFCLDLVRDPDLFRPVMLSWNATGDEGRMSSAEDVSAATIPLEKWRAADVDAVVERAKDGLHVRTGAASRVAFGSIYAPLVASESGKYLFVLSCRLLDGHIAFGALNEDRGSWLGQVGDAPASGKDMDLEYVADLREGQKFWLLVTNNREQESSASRFVLKELKISRYVNNVR